MNSLASSPAVAVCLCPDRPVRQRAPHGKGVGVNRAEVSAALTTANPSGNERR